MQYRSALHSVLMAAGLISLTGLFACVTARQRMQRLGRQMEREVVRSPVFARSLTGFHLVDAASGRPLSAVQAGNYFIPASNTKILTLATCLAVLGDSLPGLEYSPIREGFDPPITIGHCIRGTGDPTFLHPDFEAWQPVYAFLKNAGYLVLETNQLKDSRFGPGWAWDDYNYAYSAERSGMPIYGNQVRLVKKQQGWAVYPGAFRDMLRIRRDYKVGDKRIFRDEQSDTIRLPYYHEENFPPGHAINIPVLVSDTRLPDLLADTLKPADPIMVTDYCSDVWPGLVYSVPVDTVYRRLMQQSDNFFAEQLLLVCAGVRYDTLRQRDIITWARDSLFAGFPDPPRWVDGSGLSRYNLVSPRFLTSVLCKLYREQSRERLFSLFPAGGRSGTLVEWYAAPAGAAPYIVAKTGSMSGVHCLSGFLSAKSGRVYVFSFMHNNFTGANTPWKVEMERLLLRIWEKG